MMKAVALLSGGLDSSTLVYWLKRDMLAEITALSFYYGQRHKRELQAAADIADRLSIKHYVVNLHGAGSLIAGNSSLVNKEVEVPEGAYDAPSMTQTIVPNRNAIMLSIAYGVAVANGYDTVAFAAHAGDHEIYPDCREDFASAFESAMILANRPHYIELLRPFITSTKAEIVQLGADLHVPYELTWSCYKGDTMHCGRCGTCVERAEAFDLAGVPDPTEYVDPDYWRTVTYEKE